MGRFMGALFTAPVMFFLSVYLLSFIGGPIGGLVGCFIWPLPTGAFVHYVLKIR